MLKSTTFSILAFLISTATAVAIAEGTLRLKNSSMRNYDIEMWRYARELKVLSDNSTLGHEHIRNTSAILQSVNIRTNESALRGGIVPPVSVSGGRRILFLGSFITLGWGVSEEETITSRLQEKFAQR